MYEIKGNEAGIPQGDRPTAVALGFFDGIHRGHQAIIGQALQTAQEQGLASVVHTFQVAPKILLGRTSSGIQITSMEEKLDILQSMGVQYVVADDFNPTYRAMSPQEFVDKVLVQRLGAKMVSAGFHYHFGQYGAGNAQLLQELCEQRGIQCHITQRIANGQETISSTAIRGLMERGDIEKANELLGRRYFVLAEVVRGKQLGRKLGFPTINQNIKENSIMLHKGVYVTRVLVDGVWHLGVTNVGRRPSVDGAGRENIETFIFDFHGDLYGRTLKVEFVCRLRDEKKFPTLEQLQQQIELNKMAARAWEAQG